MVAHALNFITQVTEVYQFLWGQSGLYIKFQSSQGYLANAPLKKKAAAAAREVRGEYIALLVRDEKQMHKKPNLLPRKSIPKHHFLSF